MPCKQFNLNRRAVSGTYTILAVLAHDEASHVSLFRGHESPSSKGRSSGDLLERAANMTYADFQCQSRLALRGNSSRPPVSNGRLSLLVHQVVPLHVVRKSQGTY